MHRGLHVSVDGGVRTGLPDEGAVVWPVGVSGVSSSAIQEERNRAGRIRGVGLEADGDAGGEPL